jgi:hypothetical protein
MCDRARHLRARARFALVLLCATAASLPAQDPDSLQARADSLLRVWHAAQAFADLVDSLERARAADRRDTVRAGGIRIITSPSPLPVREAAELAWPALDSLLGNAASRLTDHPYIVVPWDPDTAGAPPTIHAGIPVPWDLDALALRDVLWANVPLELDGMLTAWLGGPVRLWRHPERQRESAYLELVTAPSTAARGCLMGDIQSCRAVLDVGGASDPLDRWYPSAGERRVLAAGPFGHYFDRGATAGAFRACFAGADSVCSDLLRSLPAGTLARPLGHPGRDALLKLALQVGGRDAFTRLAADSAAPLADRLEAAAGVSTDSLVARWRTSIIASRPAPVTLPTFAWWVAIGWAAAFAGCALRSSRWRLG